MKRLLRKPWKIIKKDNTELMVFTNHHWKEIEYGIPEWNKDDENPETEPYFTYYGERYFMSEFIRIGEGSLFGKFGIEIHGYTNDSAFSGVCVHYHSTEELVKVFAFIG